MKQPFHPIIFVIDGDNTLLDTDRVQDDLKGHIETSYGRVACERYWQILEDLATELGYRDYLAALQLYRSEHPREVELLAMNNGECAGLAEAAVGCVLIYIRKGKALDDIDHRAPSDRPQSAHFRGRQTILERSGNKPCSLGREVIRTVRVPAASRRRTGRSTMSPTCSTMIWCNRS